jgi:hypothetical protein
MSAAEPGSVTDRCWADSSPGNRAGCGPYSKDTTRRRWPAQELPPPAPPQPGVCGAADSYGAYMCRRRDPRIHRTFGRRMRRRSHRMIRRRRLHSRRPVGRVRTYNSQSVRPGEPPTPRNITCASCSWVLACLVWHCREPLPASRRHALAPAHRQPPLSEIGPITVAIQKIGKAVVFSRNGTVCHVNFGGRSVRWEK